MSRPPKAPGDREFHAAIGRGADAWYGACRRITGNDTLAQDAVQDALLQAWSKRAQFRGGARLETWIHRIAVNRALSLLRRRRPESADGLDALHGTEPSPLATRAREELGRDLDAALGTLSDMERICLVLKHLEQWKLAEIGSELGVSTGAVKQALFRALNKLRADLAPARRQA